MSVSRAIILFVCTTCFLFLLLVVVVVAFHQLNFRINKLRRKINDRTVLDSHGVECSPVNTWSLRLPSLQLFLPEACPMDYAHLPKLAEAMAVFESWCSSGAVVVCGEKAENVWNMVRRDI